MARTACTGCCAPPCPSRPTPASSTTSSFAAALALVDAASAAASTSVLSDANVILYSDLIAGVLETEYRRPPTKQSDTAALLYSSGTTGATKGVILTHRNFIAAATMVTSDQDARGYGTNVFLCFVPMFHILGLCIITLAQL
ncbi:4-coumarate--CoA ligase-like 1 [Phragmites australis]|uniref:4-coumarate--CoA ligase-like 1 n=1 Tax=Phragmites australis TaxID=29695 RepID=UPI002D775C11|nr:4-coumarate--CoA ligase-like 1 [Phragmites australis]